MHTTRTANNHNRIEWINSWINLYGGTVQNADNVWSVDYRDNPNNWITVNGNTVMIPMKRLP